MWKYGGTTRTNQRFRCFRKTFQGHTGSHTMGKRRTDVFIHFSVACRRCSDIRKCVDSNRRIIRAMRVMNYVPSYPVPGCACHLPFLAQCLTLRKKPSKDAGAMLSLKYQQLHYTLKHSVASSLRLYFTHISQSRFLLLLFYLHHASLPTLWDKKVTLVQLNGHI